MQRYLWSFLNNNLTFEQAELEQLQLTHDELENDVVKVDDAFQKLSAHLKEIEKQMEGVLSRERALQEDIESLSKQKNTLNHQIESQAFSAEDVNRCMRDLENLTQSQAHLQQVESELKSQVWHLEGEIARLADQVERQVHEFNEKGVQLQIIPMDAKNSNGQEFQLHFVSKDDPLSCITPDLKTNIKVSVVISIRCD
jgi:SMC interacting uncharacterized protein involved in chromosome segregation